MKLENRIETLTKKEAFIIFKDHKPNFINNPKCRLINPAKSNIGKVSKKLLDAINSEIRRKSGLLQWRNSSAVISWFRNFSNKNKCKFLVFDIVDFYPSISKKLLTDAINFGKQYSTIDSDTSDIIFHCRKSVLFGKNSTWIKNNGSLFDVTMGSFDGAELCELVGLFLLSGLASIIGKSNVGLYRDDGIAILENTPGPDTERIKKKIMKFFQQNGLKITIDANVIQANFLDVTFNLQSDKYWPYRKPNDHPLYIHSRSNHPPSIKKQLPSMLAERLSQLSCNQHMFNKATVDYQEAMRKSGYHNELKYQHSSSPTIPAKTKKRKRKILWFNAPFSEHVKTNIGRNFLNLLEKHFPSRHRLHKICNKNTVKTSYSCMPNMAAILSRHNKTILASKNTNEHLPCNCRRKAECPLNGDCRRKAIVYKASLSTDSNDPPKSYYGCCETEFKARFYNHRQTFKNKQKRYTTELSKAFWEAMDNGREPHVEWSISARSSTYQPGAARCNLCLDEKLAILLADPPSTLNKRTELTGKCRHKNKFKLKNFT